MSEPGRAPAPEPEPEPEPEPMREAEADDRDEAVSRLMAEGRQGPDELSLDLPAAHSQGRMARKVLRAFAVSKGLAEADVQTLEFVADELVTNAIDHGGGQAAREEHELVADVRMKLSLVVRADAWELRVEDQGGGTPEDVAHVVGKDVIPDLDDERGRGFFLLGQMVDRLEVETSRDGRGLAFVATKRHGPGAE